MPNSEPNCRQRLELAGVVQGVGLRPFVFNLAQRWNLTGFIRNHSAGVTIEIEGEREPLSRFVACLQNELPSLARLDSLTLYDISALGDVEFLIVASAAQTAVSTSIAPDVATCDACLAELQDPANRRYRYPFINCTQCGPRYTIIRGVPYDRPSTTMDAFPLCAACMAEYHDPSDRRFHAQANACPECGPRLWWVSAESCADGQSFAMPTSSVGPAALAEFEQAIHAHQIVAVKGIGGFHLACAADSPVAIAKLRQRKGRVEKPFAIMVHDLATAEQLAEISADEARLLASRERPIVLLRRRSNAPLADAIAPRNRTIGIMLAYSGLHALLAERRPLVFTSGNLGEEPIARTNTEAYERLRPLADAFLLHDREIHAACDDSVVQIVQGRELPVRRSRGYAPLPLWSPSPLPPLLAVGGELKVTFCLTKDHYAYLSPHIGDLSNLATLDAFGRTVEHLTQLFRVTPEVVVCDKHPEYLSSRWARDYAARRQLPLVEVQHHHAHVAAVMAEHRVDRGEHVLGFSFDGTGYGLDGAIWGGELLIASYHHCERYAHLKYVPLPGGDASIRHPYRAALAHLWSANLPWDERLPCVASLTIAERTILQQQLERNINCVPTSSLGRLFDAVAALIGLHPAVTYEAQAAIELEQLADDASAVEPYPFGIHPGTPRVIDPGPLLVAICHDVLAHVSTAAISTRFHRTIAQIMLDVCITARQDTGLRKVVLSGGVFQNRVLTELACKLLEAHGFTVLIPRQVPPNDGGLALGQAFVAAHSRSAW